MFYLDDLVMSPFKGFLFIAKEVAKAVEQEKEKERTNNMSELSALHARLEAGEISEEEFDERQLDSDDGLVFEFESEDGMPKGYWPIMLRLSNRSLKYQGLVLSRTTPDLVVARIKEILLGIKKAEANRQKGSQFNS